MPPRNNKRKNYRKNYRKNKRYSKRKAYAPKNKKRFIAKSNPVSENKQVEAEEISHNVGNNLLGNPILTDYSNPPRYLNNEPAFDDDFVVANLPTGSSGYPLADAVFNFNPDSCLYQTHGFDESSMIGRSTFQRMTAAKFLIKWPQKSMNTGKWNGQDDWPENTDPLADRVAWLTAPANNIMGNIPSSPCTYHLYWGFINVKMGLTGYTDPKATEASAVEIERHINLRVEDWFNQRLDRTRFIPKTSNTMKIIGKKLLRPPWDARSGRMPVSYAAEAVADDFTNHDGTIPDTLVKITWPINRKIHFQPTNNFSGDGVAADGTPVSGTTTFYKNFDWMPFAVIVNWNADKLPKNVGTPAAGEPFTQAMTARTQVVPHVLINDITYYRDS